MQVAAQSQTGLLRAVQRHAGASGAAALRPPLGRKEGLTALFGQCARVVREHAGRIWDLGRTIDSFYAQGYPDSLFRLSPSFRGLLKPSQFSQDFSALPASLVLPVLPVSPALPRSSKPARLPRCPARVKLFSTDPKRAPFASGYPGELAKCGCLTPLSPSGARGAGGEWGVKEWGVKNWGIQKLELSDRAVNRCGVNAKKNDT